MRKTKRADADEALRDIRGYAAAGPVLFVPHAIRRMGERGVRRGDVFEAIRTARVCKAGERERWVVRGRDLDGEDLTVVAVLSDGVVVVTVLEQEANMSKKCATCGRRELGKATEDYPIKAAGHTFVVPLPASRCAACGESFVDAEQLEAAELAVARMLSENAGQVDGDVFRFMRKALGLSGAMASELLGVAAETISRWENGERTVDRLAWTVLATMVSDRMEGRVATTAVLGAARHPRKLPKTVRLQIPKRVA